MNFYEIALIGRKLAPLIYAFSEELQIGQIVGVNIRGSHSLGIILSQIAKPNFKCKEIEFAKDDILPNVYLEMAKFIAKYYVCEIGEALGIFEIFNPNPCCALPNIVSSVALSAKQDEALTFLRQNQISLLFGDTGSGKTEIYMKRIDEVLALGQTAIILLPEIALTPQTLSRLREHYGQSVAMWHSKITKLTKNKTLQTIASGVTRILIGARSALFVPMPKLGLIIVDEEHDDSFKSESTPRYNAKDLAIWLAKTLNIPIILGSATPSLNSYTKFPSFRLKGGFVDGDKKYIFDDAVLQITPTIILSLKEAAVNGMQSIVFLPTRAHFKYLVCLNCKAKINCNFCSVGMSLHKNDKVLKCHYCGWSKQTPIKCDVCGGELSALRLGTMEAAEAIKDALPDLSVAVLDKDAASTPKKLSTILKEFSSEKTHILVGTQMLSKGHDYGKVGLGVVLGIDSILASSDFRAREKALSLLIQLSGRAGRKGNAKVIIQTQNREFFEKYLYDYESFLHFEKELRIGRYPPFVRFCRLIFQLPNALKAQEKMQLCLNALDRNKNIQIVGYGEAFINKINGKFRYEILIKSESVKAIIDSARLSQQFEAVIDMDPLSFN